MGGVWFSFGVGGRGIGWGLPNKKIRLKGDPYEKVLNEVKFLIIQTF